MDFWDATKVMWRRWYVAVPMLLIALGATGYTATAVEPDYVLTSYIQLIPPQTTYDKDHPQTGPINPWAQLGLEALSGAANYSTLDQTFLDSLQKGGFSTNFTITVGEPVAGVTIEVIGATKEQAVQTTDMVIKQFEERARDLQAKYGVHDADMITTQRLDQGENLKRPDGKVKRAIIAVFGTGLLLMCAVTIGLDAFLRRRARLRADAAESDGAEPVVSAAAAQRDTSFNGARRTPRDAETTLIPIVGNGVSALRASQSTDDDASDPAKRGQASVVRPPSHAPSDATIILPVGGIRSSGERGGSRR